MSQIPDNFKLQSASDASRGVSRVFCGYACDGHMCKAMQMAHPGKSVAQTLQECGWLVEYVHGWLGRAWCPRCRKGKVTTTGKKQ